MLMKEWSLNFLLTVLLTVVVITASIIRPDVDSLCSYIIITENSKLIDFIPTFTDLDFFYLLHSFVECGVAGGISDESGF